MNVVDEMQKTYWKQYGDMIALSMYARSFPMNYTTGEETIYLFEKETHIIKHPGFDNLDVSRFSHQRALNYGYPWNLGHYSRLNNSLANFGNIRRLPLQMRATFVPSSCLPLQQSCAGPLAMPSFLFSRMSQSLCSLPLPPPLPQIALLYLQNDAQQMVMQQYVNPVAVLPFIPNWQISQPMMFAPQVLQQQQQSIIPIPTFHSGQPVFPLQMPSLQADRSQASRIPQYSNSGYPSICRACIPVPPSFNSSVTNNSWIQYCPACHHILAASFNPNIRPANGRSTPLLRSSAVLQNVHNQTRQQYQYPHINGFASMNSWLRKTPPLPPGAIIIYDEYINKSDSFQEHHNLQKHQKQPQRIERSITINIDNMNKSEPHKNQPLRKVTKTDSDISSRQPTVKSKSFTESSRSAYSSLLNEYVNPKKPSITSNNRNQSIDHEQLPPKAPNINIHSNDQPHNLSVAHNTDLHLNSNNERLNSLSNSDVLRDLRFSLTTEDNQIDSPVPTPNNSTKEEEQSDDITNKFIHTTSSTPSQSTRSETKSFTPSQSKRSEPRSSILSQPRSSTASQLKRSETKSSTASQSKRSEPRSSIASQLIRSETKSSTPSQSKISEPGSSTIYETTRTTPSTIRTNSRNTLNSTKDKLFDTTSITSTSKIDKQIDRNLSIIETL